MADLTAARRSHAPRLAYGIGWEVVVQHEMLAVFTFQRIDDLLILAGSQGGGNQRLGFASGKERRTMGPRQDPRLAHDLADGFGVASVDTRLSSQNLAADHITFES